MANRSRSKRRENQPCWCGSGEKYKKCHQKRENEPAVTLQEATRTFKKVWGKEYCLSPLADKSVCSPVIVKAHTIQKNGGLSQIARKGHVYGFKYHLGVIGNDGLPTPTLLGINSASTFTGFCAYHDNLIFEPIEKHSFQSTLQQTFLLGYRAINRELFAKKGQFELIPFTLGLDKGKSHQEQAYIQDYFQTYNAGVILGLNELKCHKSKYDEILLSSDFTQVKHYVIQFENTPEVMCSGSVQLEYDFNGRMIQKLETVGIAEQMTFSLIGTDSGGAAVFNWLGENKVCLNFIQSLHSISDNDIPHAILRFCFDSF